ncbi:MAG: VOC family protein [Deltaproteobacteria bacterium]|nr:VOC family protein [Deltaproteobacteria bacterium]
MTAKKTTPRLTLGHSTLLARDLDRLSAFYCDVLGFHITNRGPVGEDGSELAFLSQDPTAHHQIAMVSGVEAPDSAFVMVDHLAFRTGTLDDLRALRANITDAGIEGIIPICHGNAWSLYFSDCEGNGVECFVDTPFHVAQPFGQGFDLDMSDEDILKTTRELIESEPEFQPMPELQEKFAKRLEQS